MFIETIIIAIIFFGIFWFIKDFVLAYGIYKYGDLELCRYYPGQMAAFIIISWLKGGCNYQSES